MLPGVLALLERSLRVDSRAWGPHLARFGLMAAIYVAVCYASATSSIYGAPGLRFFRSIAYLDLVFMTLLGIGFFSTAISEEKEEDALGLMLMAGISPLGILLGKSVGRLVQALLLIGIQYPFTILAVTLGGVTQDQVRSVYLAMFAYMVMLAGVGLLCSTLSQRNRSASLRLTIFLVAYFAIPAVVQSSLPAGRMVFPSMMGGIAESCIFLRMGTILTTGVHETWLSHQVVTNLLIGGIGFAMSWWMFRVAVREPSSEAISRGLVARSEGSMRWLSPGRPTVDPLVWKDFHFVAGGIAGVLIRFGAYVLLYIIAIAISSHFVGSSWGLNFWHSTTGLYLVLMMFAVALDLAQLGSRSLHEEVRGQALATLLLLPRSTGMILYPKAIGSLIGWLPGPICLLFATAYLPFGAECTREFCSRPGPPVMLVVHLVLVPHAAALAAMFVRWGALPLGIGLTIGTAILTAVYINTLGIGPEDSMVYVIGLVILGLSVGCHIAVWLRAESLSTK